MAASSSTRPMKLLGDAGRRPGARALGPRAWVLLAMPSVSAAGEKCVYPLNE